MQSGSEECLWKRSLRQGIYLGGDEFVAQTLVRARPLDPSTPEIPVAQRRRPTPAAFAFAKEVGRNASLRPAYVEGGMTMSQIAKAAGLSVSRVSRLIALLEASCDETANRQRDDGATPEAPGAR